MVLFIEFVLFFEGHMTDGIVFLNEGLHLGLHVVATFLAVLELFKRGMVEVHQSEIFGEIDIEHVEGAGEFRIEDSDFDYETNGE